MVREIFLSSMQCLLFCLQIGGAAIKALKLKRSALAITENDDLKTVSAKTHEQSGMIKVSH